MGLKVLESYHYFGMSRWKKSGGEPRILITVVTFTSVHMILVLVFSVIRSVVDFLNCLYYWRFEKRIFLQ